MDFPTLSRSLKSFWVFNLTLIILFTSPFANSNTLLSDLLVAPANVTVNLNNDTGQAQITWDDLSTDEAAYGVYRLSQDQPHHLKYIKSLPKNSTSYTDSLSDYGIYRYRILAKRLNEEGTFDYAWSKDSNTIEYSLQTSVEPDTEILEETLPEQLTQEGPLVAPGNASVKLDGATGQVAISWTDLSTAESSYAVYQINQNRPDFLKYIKWLPKNSTSYIDTLKDYGTYHYRIFAKRRNADGTLEEVSSDTPKLTYSATVNTSPGNSCGSVTQQTCDLAMRLGNGINFGNMLDAPNEGAGGYGTTFKPHYPDLVADKFTTVRLPVRWSNHASADAAAIIDESFFLRVEEIVGAFLDKGMNVIIDMHHYNQLYGDSLSPNEYAVDDSVLETRFVNMWKQIAERFKNSSDKVLFELLNEPHKNLTAEKWNALFPLALEQVRKTNPDRAVLIGPVGWNHAAELPNLVLENDPNIIVAVHSYVPHDFTHQGLPWMTQWPEGVACCDATQTQTIQNYLQRAKDWSNNSGYPIHIGEWGATIYQYSKNGVEIDWDSRVNYIKLMKQELSERELPWTYWNFGTDFGVYDDKNELWNQPLIDALILD